MGKQHRDHRPKTDPTGRAWTEPKVDDQKIIQTLWDTNGNLAATARTLAASLSIKCSRGYVANRVNSTPALQEVLDEIRQSLLDTAEDNIFNSVISGKIEESKFVLTTIGKERGYVKTVQMEDTDAAALAKRLQDARKKAQGGETGEEAKP
jgi:hypothetical protein